MKLLSTILALVLMSVNVTMADDAKRDILPPCEGPGCNVIAQKVVLEAKAETRDLKVRIGPMVVGIPANVTRIDVGHLLTVFRYETAPHISISTETDETFQMKKLTSKPVTLSETLDIIFTKTLKDSDLTAKYDQEFLNKLMWIKKGFLEKSGEAYVYDKGRVRIYYIPEGGSPSRNLAWAVDLEHPNVAIRMESDLSVTSFAQILYSITATKKEK